MGRLHDQHLHARWATGGLTFGAVGDRIGHARALAVSILLYGLCNRVVRPGHGPGGLCRVPVHCRSGRRRRFRVGGGAVRDSLPDAARSPALGWLQALSAVGNVAAGLTAILWAIGRAWTRTAARCGNRCSTWGPFPRWSAWRFNSAEGTGEMDDGQGPGQDDGRALRLLRFAAWGGALAQAGVVRMLLCVAEWWGCGASAISARTWCAT